MRSLTQPQLHVSPAGLRWLVAFPSLASLCEVPPYLRLQVFDPHTYPACSSVQLERTQSDDEVYLSAGISSGRCSVHIRYGIHLRSRPRWRQLRFTHSARLAHHCDQVELRGVLLSQQCSKQPRAQSVPPAGLYPLLRMQMVRSLANLHEPLCPEACLVQKRPPIQKQLEKIVTSVLSSSCRSSCQTPDPRVYCARHHILDYILCSDIISQCPVKFPISPSHAP